MRYYRIPVFTGIEGHRNKPDRGTMRVVEGCIPYPAGGLRSGPIWTTLGTVSNTSTSNPHQFWTVTDDLGNKFLFIIDAAGEVYGVHVFPATQSTPKIGAVLSSQSEISVTGVGTWGAARAYSSNVGNRWVAVGNGAADATIIGMGDTAASATSSDIHALGNVEFPKCTMFTRGPRKCVYAAGNPDAPLTVYITEPAGITSPTRGSIYSDSAISRVDILLTDATEITALSTLGPYVVVHTDHGVTLLYGTKPDNAETGFRTEQVASPVSSAAINHRVVGGQQNQPFFLARDGQIYKDESTTAGPDGKPMYSDPRQVSWKAKGLWSDDSAHEIGSSFSSYDPGIGMYFVYLPTKEGAI